MTWATDRATRAKAQQEANEAAGRCPSCGAPADVDLIDISWGDRNGWLPGRVHCSERCDEVDPDAYLTAVKHDDAAR